MRGAQRPRGFTLLELLLVVALIAVSVGMVSLSLRDADANRLEEEAQRLSALLDSARARSRAMGRPVAWQPVKDGSAFRFSGLPDGQALPSQWLDERTRAQVDGAPELVLGPEPIGPPQRVRLVIGERSLTLGTDGLGPFQRLDETGSATP
ncbi:prepilin-type N-terminal cleavage/methylation domain-containing protein [Ideonella livida]|uniref:Prepilin-type N-terminal cleavage/methylation domain-containing protein n=1 Tax=Ideonella livida TaxID=2707176 RepID=A0A7C9PIE2_9BURK|nr:prepilin-type N-terminal cleavage/methylation domain-containing protein [Ideonella livida]NDY92773.1 prepilin-type N-terminal cleavage/methylation domain-containing protein [Ideonella livida]